jgi:hypothetical protein
MKRRETPMEVTLADESAARNFMRGTPLRLTWLDDRATFVRASSLWRARQWLWSKLTGPFRRKVIVTRVDVESGVITADLEPKRWWHLR